MRALKGLPSRATSWLRERIPFIASAAVLALAAAAFMTSESASNAAQVGDFIAGIAGSLAFIWLVAGYRLQANELSLQRDEIRLQRLAIEQQARELSNAAKLGSLEQIRSLLGDAERCVRDSTLEITNPNDIQVHYFRRMEFWKIIEESRDSEAVIQAYQNWLPAETVARNYIRYIASAIRIYIEYHHPNASIEHDKEPEDFVFVYQSWVYKAPYLSHHIGPAAMLSQYLWLMRPGLNRMRLAWMVASTKSLGKDMLKEGALEQFRDEVLQHSERLPAICTPWPN